MTITRRAIGSHFQTTGREVDPLDVCNRSADPDPACPPDQRVVCWGVRSAPSSTGVVVAARSMAPITDSRRSRDLDESHLRRSERVPASLLS